MVGRKPKKEDQLPDGFGVLHRKFFELEKARDKIRQDEDALRQKDRFLFSVFSSIQDGISVIDKDMRIVRVNPIMERWYSHAMPLVGKRCYQAYHGRSQRCQACPSYKTLQTGQAAYEIAPRIGPDGKVSGWSDLYSFPLTDTKTGQMNGVIEYVRDITLRRKLEDELKEEKDKAQKYLDVVGTIVVAIDLNQNISLINTKGCQILGYKQEDILGKNWFDNFIPQRIRTQVKAAFRKLISGNIESVEYYENPVLTCDGSERLIQWHNVILTEEKSKVTGTLSSGQDITQRKKVEDALRESEEKYHKLVNNASDAILLADMEGRILEVNKKAEKLLGYTKDELLKMDITRIHPQETIKNNIIGFKKILQAGSGAVYGTAVLKKNGDVVPVDITGSVIEYSGKKVLQEIFRDITKQKEVQDAAQKLREDLEIRVQKRTMDLVKSNIALSDEITERKRIAEALKKSELKYRTIFENTGTAMMFVEADTAISMANAQMEKLSGYSQRELEGKSWLDFVSREDFKMVKDYHRARRLNPGTVPKSYGFRFVDKLGNIKNVYATVAMIAGTKTSVISLIDLTEYKKPKG